MKMNDKKETRIPKDEYFMQIAELVSQRSTCIRRKVGAVLVKDSHILSTGYNGAPTGFRHCTPELCVRKDLPSGKNPELCRGLCAEINCIIQAAIHGTSIEGNTTLYCTTFPCTYCLKSIINAGIKRLLYKEGYDMENQVKKDLLIESKLIIQKVS
ncbi:MAG: cytidine deaminase [Candidatus Lokiarchaeota archaeon]|nr:cytidine deaminase [Candidatus Lokiarchaeota archaeon]MBD3340923.1 cytidine deaminase [Candidatus Lokiarchaeota archaeon]